MLVAMETHTMVHDDTLPSNANTNADDLRARLTSSYDVQERQRDAITELEGKLEQAYADYRALETERDELRDRCVKLKAALDATAEHALVQENRRLHDELDTLRPRAALLESRAASTRPETIPALVAFDGVRINNDEYQVMPRVELTVNVPVDELDRAEVLDDLRRVSEQVIMTAHQTIKDANSIED